MSYKSIFISAVFAVLLVSCGKQAGGNADVSGGERADVRYAKGFDIVDYGDYKQVLVYNPWVSGTVQQRFYLTANDSIETPKDGIRMKTPVKTVAISSSTHTEFLALLGAADRVTAMCSPQLIYNDYLQKRYEEGRIVSIGDAFATDVERLMMLSPDAYFVSSYNQQDENSKRLMQSGVNVVYNNEWTETSLLARAEWIKYMAAFVGEEERADSIFGEIEKNYIDVKRMIAGRATVHKPKVMVGGNFKGTWYVPGGRSYMGQLLVDAGADYHYATDTTTVSIPLNFEMVLDKFAGAEVWLNAPTATMQELVAMDERHALFAPVRSGNVFSFYAKTKPSGANDFWESGVAHPDKILCDVIWAVYPDALPDYRPEYIMKLK